MPHTKESFTKDIIPRKYRKVRDLQQCDLDAMEDNEDYYEEGGDLTNADEDVQTCFKQLGIFIDFMGEVFKRNSIDNRGCDVIATVNYDFNYANAFYSDTFAGITIGNG